MFSGKRKASRNISPGQTEPSRFKPTHLFPGKLLDERRSFSFRRSYKPKSLKHTINSFVHSPRFQTRFWLTVYVATIFNTSCLIYNHLHTPQELAPKPAYTSGLIQGKAMSTGRGVIGFDSQTFVLSSKPPIYNIRFDGRAATLNLRYS